jgi:phosphoglycolate phosphatase-like HAD superfamily hydrolase
VGREIDALITADDVRHGRPAPDMITLAMTKFGIKDPTQVLKAGDSGIDIEEGKNANCGLCIGVLSGAQTKAQLERHAPDMVLEKLTDLAELI